MAMRIARFVKRASSLKKQINYRSLKKIMQHVNIYSLPITTIYAETSVSTFSSITFEWWPLQSTLLVYYHSCSFFTTNNKDAETSS